MPSRSSGLRYQIVTTPGVIGRALYERAIPKSAKEVLAIDQRIKLSEIKQTYFEYALGGQEYVLHFYIAVALSQHSGTEYNQIPEAAPVDNIVFMKVI